MVKKRPIIKRQKTSHEQHQDNHLTPLLISAAAGAIIGALVAIYKPDQNARMWGFTVSNTYNKLSDSLEDVGYAAKGTKKSSNKKILWLGAIAGGVIGLTAVTLLSNKNGRKKGAGFLDSIKGVGQSAVQSIQSIDWMDVAEHVADSVGEKIGGNEDEEEEEEEDQESEEEEIDNETSSKIQSIVNLGILGLNIWQNLKKRR